MSASFGVVSFMRPEPTKAKASKPWTTQRPMLRPLEGVAVEESVVMCVNMT
jgi:hypothetical protein